MSNSVNSRDISEAEYRARIEADQAQARAAIADLEKEMENAGEADSARNEMSFYVMMGLNESEKMGTRLVDGVVQFVKTRNQLEENRQAVASGLEAPNPYASSDWELWGEGAERARESDRQRAERLSDVINQDEPPEMQRARETMNATDPSPDEA